MLGLIAVVLTGTALLSGVVERSPLSFPLIFLALGFALGERGMGVFEMGPHDPLLNVVATLTLSLVLAAGFASPRWGAAGLSPRWSSDREPS